jgi:hypothetical protein
MLVGIIKKNVLFKRAECRLKSQCGFRWLRFGVLGASLLILHGCSLIQSPYRESHDIKNLKVVFLDEGSLQHEWTTVTQQQAVRFYPSRRGGEPTVSTLRGFYDFRTNTLYCSKWDFTTCGHELHHAVLGPFHTDD